MSNIKAFKFFINSKGSYDFFSLSTWVWVCSLCTKWIGNNLVFHCCSETDICVCVCLNIKFQFDFWLCWVVERESVHFQFSIKRIVLQLLWFWLVFSHCHFLSLSLLLYHAYLMKCPFLVTFSRLTISTAFFLFVDKDTAWTQIGYGFFFLRFAFQNRLIIRLDVHLLRNFCDFVERECQNRFVWFSHLSIWTFTQRAFTYTHFNLFCEQQQQQQKSTVLGFIIRFLDRLHRYRHKHSSSGIKRDWTTGKNVYRPSTDSFRNGPAIKAFDFIRCHVKHYTEHEYCEQQRYWIKYVLTVLRTGDTVVNLRTL